MSPIRTLYSTLVRWYGSTTVMAVGALGISLFGIAAYITFSTDSVEPSDSTTPSKVVSVQPLSEIGGTEGMINLIGTVKSTSEARLVAESGGRVTKVAVKLGDSVRAGTVLATLENDRESAAVLQAQGVYEAALAGAEAGDVTITTAKENLDEARISAHNAYRSAFTTVDGVIKNTYDQLFSDPNGLYPGLLIDGSGRASDIARERRELGAILDNWGNAQLGSDTDYTALLDTAERHVIRISTFASLLSTQYTEDESLPTSVVSLGPELSLGRGQIDALLASLSLVRSSLNQSEAAYAQAQIAGSNDRPSASDAQVKQALGALRLAQANLEKTIIRTPIAGTVQSLSLREGTTVALGTFAAIVSGEGGLEITAYLNESEVGLVRVGADAVLQDGESGTVTEIASAIDPTTQKLEVRIGMNDIKRTLVNGSTVTVSINTQTDTKQDTVLHLPIVALKMTPDGPIVFTIDSDSKLVAHSVTLGAIRGDSVLVRDGLLGLTEIVSDARGLRAGEVVTVQR